MIVDKIVFISSAIIKNENQEILLLKRSKLNKTYKNYWQLPEGKIQIDESPKEALYREIKEELSCEVIESALKRIISNSATLKNVHYLLVRVIFETKIKGKIKLDSEHLSYKWLPKENAVKNLKLIVGTKEAINL